MIRFIKKRLLLAIAILAMLVTFMCIGGAQNVNAASEQLFAELSFSDIVNNTNSLGSNPQGTKGIFKWKGIKEVSSTAITVKTSSENYGLFWIGANSEDANASRITRIEWSFTITSNVSGAYYCYGSNTGIYQNSNIKNGSNSYTITDFNPNWNYGDFVFGINFSKETTITSFSLKLYYTPGQAATITAGTGVHDVFLSSKTGVTTGDASGTVYSDGTTVYGYARLYGSYKPQSDWTYICKDNSLLL